jgi:hypothetical protein
MDFKGDNITCSSNGNAINLTSTDNGVILTPTIIDGSGSIGLVCDLQYNDTTKCLTLGKDNSIGLSNALHNISIGDSAGKFITSADDNISIGHNANRDNQTSNRNTIIGSDAGVFNTSGNNTYIGYSAGALNNSGNSSNNVAIGSEALYSNKSPSITGIGYKSLRENVNGNNLVAIGSNSLEKLGANDATPSTNIIGIGTNVLKDYVEGDNVIVIGHENLNNVFSTSGLTMVGNNNMNTQTDDFIANDCIVMGNNNFSNQSDCPEFQHQGAIVLGNYASNNINLGQGKDNVILIGNNLSITEDMVSNTVEIAGDHHSLGSFTPKYNIEMEGIQALRSKASVNGGIPNNNYEYLKNLSWNWSSNGYMTTGFPTVLFDVNMEQIDWGTQARNDDMNGKSVLFTLEFSFNGTDANRNALTVFGGSVSFLVFKNAGLWIFPNSSTVLDLTLNAGNRGYYQYSNSTFGGIYAYQSSLGNPEFQVGILWNNVIGDPLLNSTVSTNVRACLATNLIDGAGSGVISTVNNAYILSHI